MATNRIAGVTGTAPVALFNQPAGGLRSADWGVPMPPRSNQKTGPTGVALLSDDDVLGLEGAQSIDLSAVDTNDPALIAAFESALERAVVNLDPNAEVVLVITPDGRLDFATSDELAAEDPNVVAQAIGQPVAAVGVHDLLSTVVAGPTSNAFMAGDFPVGGWQPLPGWTDPGYPMAIEDKIVMIFAQILTRWANDLVEFDLETERLMAEEASLPDGDEFVAQQQLLDRAETSRRGWQSRGFTLDIANTILQSMNQTTENLLQDF